MTKSKKIQGFSNPEPVYYAYYEKSTGELISITNEKSVVHDHGIEITEGEYQKLLNGVELFSKYRVGYAKTPEGKTALALVPITDHGYSFRSNMFEWIVDPPTTDTELTVVWNKEETQWDFILSKECKNKMSDALVPSKLLFFVMLGSDFDFLVRTIDIPTNDLITSDKISIPFNTHLETRIDKISIATKLLFNTYGLSVYE